ncbi:MAG: T9SS type A sorting domain-containing protein, partial [Bacteroidia bacterium]|nr:T9SS type A sorting domain-containing protein [Bacteroidia bacterium]
VTGTDANGCMNTDMVTITVNALPSVSLTLTQTSACVSAPAVGLAGGSPAAGTWAGTGVTGSSFNPSVSGAGTFAITYSFTDANGCSASAVDSFLVDACIGIAGVSFNTISIYPNPNNGSFTIKSNSETVYTLINEMGQTIESFKLNGSNNYSKSFEGLSNGIYFVMGYDNNRVVKQKIVVTR